MLSDHGTSCCKPSASCLEAKCLFSLIFCLLQMRCVLHQSCRLVCDRRKNDAQVLRSGKYPEWILGEKVARVLMFLYSVLSYQYLNQCALTKPSLFARSNWTFLASAVVKTKEKVPSANRGSYMNPGDVRTQSWRDDAEQETSGNLWCSHWCFLNTKILDLFPNQSALKGFQGCVNLEMLRV